MSRTARLEPHPPAADASSAPGATPPRSAGVGALLVANALLRIGAVGAGTAVQFHVTDLAFGHPSGIAVGLVGASQALPEMVFAPFLARMADRLGRRRFLVGGPLVSVLGLLLLGLTRHSHQVALSRLVEGVGAAAFVPTALGAIAAATSMNVGARARASSAFEGSTLLGYAGGFVVGSFLYHSLHHRAFFVLAFFYLVAALICWVRVAEVAPLPLSPLRAVVRVITGPGPVRIFIPAWLAVNALVGAFYTNLGALLKRSPVHGQTLVHGFDERVIAVFLLTWVVLLVAGIVLWTPVLRRLGGPRTMLRAVPGAFLVMAVLVVVNHLPLIWAPAFVPLLAVGVMIQAGFGPAAVAYLADCSEAVAGDRSALMAFYTVTLAGGGALGAVFGGLMSRWLLVDGLVLLGAVLSTIAWLSLRAVVRYDSGRTDRSEAAAPV